MESYWKTLQNTYEQVFFVKLQLYKVLLYENISP